MLFPLCKCCSFKLIVQVQCYLLRTIPPSCCAPLPRSPLYKRSGPTSLPRLLRAWVTAEIKQWSLWWSVFRLSISFPFPDYQLHQARNCVCLNPHSVARALYILYVFTLMKLMNDDIFLSIHLFTRQTPSARRPLPGPIWSLFSVPQTDFAGANISISLPEGFHEPVWWVLPCTWQVGGTKELTLRPLPRATLS